MLYKSLLCVCVLCCLSVRLCESKSTLQEGPGQADSLAWCRKIPPAVSSVSIQLSRGSTARQDCAAGLAGCMALLSPLKKYKMRTLSARSCLIQQAGFSAVMACQLLVEIAPNVMPLHKVTLSIPSQ